MAAEKSIENPKAENVRLQIINYLQPRFGNILSGEIIDYRNNGTFALRKFKGYQDKICFQKKLVLQGIIIEPSLKDKIDSVRHKYEDLGFDIQTPGGKDGTGCFAAKSYEDTNWKNGELTQEALEEIAQDFETLIKITQPFEDLLVPVKSRTASSARKKNVWGVKMLDTQNRIYFGAPGTGKSHQLKQDVEAKFGKNFERVTFYPTYSYQQFVGSYKPFVKKIVEKNNQGQDVVRDEITYKFVPGPLMRLLVKAWKAEEGYRQAFKKLEGLNSEVEQDVEAIKKANRFVLIVEELNRAEAAAVFGDFFQLLDRGDNGESVYKIAIPEELKARLEEEGVTQEELYLPANFYIWATMNNADQGVTPLDTAFKRRWEFEYIGLDDGEKGELNAPEEKLWNKLRKSINEGLRKLAVNEDKLLGPFFMKAKGLTQEDFWKTFCDKVVLYLYEDAARLRRKDCFKGSNITYSDLRKKLVTEFKDWETCQTTLEEVFSFEITNTISEKDWPWTPQTKDGPTENETDGEPPVGESGAQGESTSDNL